MSIRGEFTSKKAGEGGLPSRLFYFLIPFLSLPRF